MKLLQSVARFTNLGLRGVASDFMKALTNMFMNFLFASVSVL